MINTFSLGATRNMYNNFSYQRALLIVTLLSFTDLTGVSVYCLNTQFKRDNNIKFSITWAKRKIIASVIYYQNEDFLFLCFRCLMVVIFTIWLMTLIVLSNNVELNPGPNAAVDTSLSSNISSDKLLSGLSIMHINIPQSLRPKLDILEIEAQSYDILVISETWLSPSTDNNAILIPNFNPPFRCDRIGKIGGGVAIYIRETLAGSIRPDLSIRDLEFECFFKSFQHISGYLMTFPVLLVEEDLRIIQTV